jgi:hypothetical protein
MFPRDRRPAAKATLAAAAVVAVAAMMAVTFVQTRSDERRIERAGDCMREPSEATADPSRWDEYPALVDACNEQAAPQHDQPSVEPEEPATSNVTAFQTPTGNIVCGGGSSGVRCDIGDLSWSPPPKPASCAFDWGQSLQISSDGTSAFGCVSDAVADGGPPVLAYGESTRFGDVECTSRQDGLTCTNTRTKHGFFLSRARYDLF